MCRHRGSKVTELRDICRCSDINAFGVVVERRVGSGKGGRETTVHRGIDELGTLTEEDLSEMVKAETRLFHDIAHRHGLEIATMVNFTSFAVNEGVVSG